MSLAPLILPAISSKAPATLLFLHGLGDSGHGWASAFKQTLGDAFPSLRVVLPNAPSLPLTINGGQKMPQWFDIKHQDARSRSELQDLEGMERTRTMVESLIKKERDEGRKVVLGGFSQGAAMTLFTGLQTSQHLEGLIVLSGSLPQQATIQSYLPATPLSLPFSFGPPQRTSSTLVPSRASSFPVFLAHGTHDRTISFDHGIKIRDFLEWKPEAGGLGLQKVTWWEMGGIGHSSDEREMLALKAWLGGVLGWEEVKKGVTGVDRKWEGPRDQEEKKGRR